jgi:hypothetical protein
MPSTTAPRHLMGTCTLDWHTPHHVLQLTVRGQYTVEDAVNMNRAIVDALDSARTPLAVLIDATEMKRPTNFDVLRETQTFIQHERLAKIYVASTDRLVRFSMMVIYTNAGALLRVFDSVGQANQLLSMAGVRSF